MDCVFCKIAKKEAPADIAYEDEEFLVFHDIRPKAALHLLLIPKKHIPTLQEAEERDIELLGKLLLTAQKVGRLKQLKGYKLQMNVGKEGGQEVDHVHLHLLAQS
ncbi:MAG TPA: histidine triad nucleotide-binding protein [Candidatus Paceibacterota bacterium]